MNWKHGIIAGLVTFAVTFVVSMVLEFAYPPRSYWFISQFPKLMVGSGLVLAVFSMVVSAFVMGIAYQKLHSVVPGSGIRKGATYGLMFFFIGGLMFPIMMFGYAPLMIAISEMVFSAINYIIAGIAVQKIYAKLN